MSEITFTDWKDFRGHLTACSVCGATVGEPYQEMHRAWHERQAHRQSGVAAQARRADNRMRPIG